MHRLMPLACRGAAVWVVAAIGLLLLARPMAAEDKSGGRVSQGLLVLYTFEEPSGDVVQDRSGVGERLDLKIERPQAVSRSAGQFRTTSSARIVSAAPAKKITEAVKQSGELTLEAWVRPNDDRQAGPARIVSLSSDTTNRNFTLGQNADRYDVRLRTTKTDANGLPSLSTPASTAKTELTHVVYTRDRAGAAKIYLNGAKQAAADVAGELSGWSDDFRLSLANELTGDRPWLGELRLVAVYGRALAEEEIARNFAAGVKPPIDYAALLPPPANRPIDFVKDVQPILRKRCFECHAQGNEEGGLNLGVRSRVLEGGKGGAVLVRGDGAASRLVHAIAAIDEKQAMPPDGDRLSAEQVGIVRAWIDQGAAWPPEADVLDPRTEQAKQHWAFQPLRTVEPPSPANAAWSRTPIDRFVLAKLEAAGLQPTASLAPRGLIRRVAFDLVGLPPAAEESEAFSAAAEGDSEAAWLALVDKLLATRHYGERWGRHWLDAARYADSNGQEGDQDRPTAYRYRDFVIRAFNDDMPFDAFLRWQLAGDEYEPNNPAAVAATGFLVAGPHTELADTFLEEELLRNRYNELDDMLDTTGKAMLGLTFGCARCHDHKYDAISSREYYRLLSAFHGGDRAEVPLGTGKDTALAFRDFGAEPKTTWLFGRGDFYDRDQSVRLGFLDVLSKGKTAEDYWNAARREPPRADTTYQRRALADWLTDIESGAGALAARVIVNRVWQHHFGEGLVRSVDDFGVRSDPPSHPELLEWLADDFVRHGWKLKRLHRLVLTSAVYRQGVAYDAAKHQKDPENRLLWRMRPRRLEAEIVRDSLLAAAGTLNLAPYGPAFQPAIAAEAKTARNLKTPYPQDVADSPEVRRRSVYMFHKRVIPYPLLAAFDRPDALQSCGRRENTTVAPQALALLNDAFVRSRAAEFADRVLQETLQVTGDRGQQESVDRVFLLALGRPPSDAERAASLEFLQAQTQRRKAEDAKLTDDELRRLALADYCQSIFGLNEFIYID